MGSFSAVWTPEGLELIISVLIKLGLGAFIGAVIGYEREVHGRPAGIRTHMLMVMGVVLFCEVSKNFSNGDQGRIAAQVLTGVGFLGAGTILRLGAEIKGLTSAASIWAAAALGMAVSTGGAFFVVAIAGTILCLVTLSIVDSLERKLVPHAHVKSLQVHLESSSQVGSVVEAVAARGCAVKSVSFVHQAGPVIAELGVTGEEALIIAAASECDGVKSAHWTN